MELIIAILFFSVSAVVCVQLFVQSHLTNAKTSNLASSNIIIQNMADGYLGCDGSLEELHNILSDSKYDEELSQLSLYMDSSWNTISPSDSNNAAYTATVYSSIDDSNMMTATITILDASGNTISTQTVNHYIQSQVEVQP